LAATGCAAVLVAFGLVLPGRYLVMAAWLVPVGLLVAPGAMAGARAVFAACAPARRGLAMSVRQTGVTVGAAAAAAWLPLVAYHRGLGPTFLLLAGVLLVPALLLALVIPAGRADPDGPAGPRAAIASLRGVALPAVISALLAAGQYDLITYTLADLTDRVGLTLALASLTLGIVQVGGVGGRLLLGWLSDRRDRPTAVATAAGAGALLFVALALLPHATPLAARAGVMLLLGACAVGWNGVCLTWVGEAGGNAGTGLKLGLGAGAVYFGASVFPPVFGLVVSATGSYGAGWLMLAAQFTLAGTLAMAARRRHTGPGAGPCRASPR
ncbi:MAG: MFS transporter, partial [Acidimicrobiales bacterium]